MCRLQLDLELTAGPGEEKDVKCGDNSTREQEEKSKEEEENSSSGEVEDEGSSEISLERREDAVDFSNEPNYPSYADAYS